MKIKIINVNPAPKKVKEYAVDVLIDGQFETFDISINATQQELETKILSIIKTKTFPNDWKEEFEIIRAVEIL